jgi:hypothetical protein
MAAGLFATGFIACSVPPPVPAVSPPPPTVATPAPSTATVPLEVEMAGTITCQTFPYSCYAVVSVVPDGTLIDAGWRPSDTDPAWFAIDQDGTAMDHFHDAPDSGGLPALAAGRQVVVVSLLGSYDVPSYDASGRVARDLRARCSAPLDVAPASAPIRAVITFVPGGAGFDATCSIRIQAP